MGAVLGESQPVGFPCRRLTTLHLYIILRSNPSVQYRTNCHRQSGVIPVAPFQPFRSLIERAVPLSLFARDQELASRRTPLTDVPRPDSLTV